MMKEAGRMLSILLLLACFVLNVNAVADDISDELDYDDSNFENFQAIANFPYEVEHPLIDLKDSPVQELYSENGTLDIVLVLDICRAEFWHMGFNTRCYNGSSPGPTIHVNPGDRLTVTIINNLGPQSEEYEFLELHYPNTTNLHIHGTHVSSSEDDVFLEISPGTTDTYTYNFPQDHYPGSFWYHAHYHGSSAYQITGGLVGALFVEPHNSSALYGDFLNDAIWHYALMNELKMYSYDSGEYHGYIEYDDEISSDVEVDLWYRDNNTFYLNSHTVNGIYQPVVHMRRGEWHIFQLINAAASFLLEIAITNTDSCEMYTIGIDGVYTRAGIFVEDVVYIPAGGRADVAVRCADSGFYAIRNTEDYPTDDYLYFGIDRPMVENLIYLQVESDDVVDSLTIEDYEEPSKPSYLEDIYDVPDELIAGRFSIETSFVDTDEDRFGFNDEVFIDQGVLYQYYMEVGKIYEFYIYSEWTTHPVHIHINHMQIVSDVEINGTIEYVQDNWPPDIDDGFDFNSTFPIYSPGEWHDTIVASVFRNITIRTKPTDHTGPVLCHCHYVQHADRGMLMEMYIDMPDDDSNSTTESS